MINPSVKVGEGECASSYNGLVVELVAAFEELDVARGSGGRGFARLGALVEQSRDHAEEREVDGIVQKQREQLRVTRVVLVGDRVLEASRHQLLN